MPRLAASVSWMFNEAPLLDRFALAASAGFAGVEIQAPYGEPAARLAERARAAGVAVLLINTPSALAAVPDAVDAFRDQFTTALDYAAELDCPRIHCLAGPSAGESSQTTMVDNVRWAADQAADAQVDIMLEPLNTIDHPDYFLTSSAQALHVIEAVGRPNVRLQYDCYHMQLMEGRLTQNISGLIDQIGHIQISGVPGRCEPDAEQEINYPYIFALLDELGYDGWFGCEYRPRNGTLAGLGWARPYGIAAPDETELAT